MFQTLSDRLGAIFQRLRSRGKLTEGDVSEVLREVRIALLEADVNLKVVKDLIASIRERAVGAEVLESLTPAQSVIKIVRDGLVALMGSQAAPIQFAPTGPTAIMLVGLQGSGKTTHEKDRPRFRVDVSIFPKNHATVQTALVKILSLGSLPLTINHGEIFIEASHYPERVEPKKLDGREIGPLSPVEVQFTLPLKLINPWSGGKPTVKLISKFSYGEDDEEYSDEKTYNRDSREFE